MINYFSFQPFEGGYLITNDAGYYAFVTGEELHDLQKDEMDPESEKGRELTDKCFLYRDSREDFLSRMTPPLRQENGCLFGSTTLHIFILTTACNLQCIYCQARSGDEISFGKMSADTAERAVDFALQSPGPELTFEFQGGEPLVNFEVIRHIVEYAEAHRGKKHIAYSLVSNLTLATDEILDFFREHEVSISTSLDGCEKVHNHNRPYVNGDPSFAKVLQGIQRVRDHGMNPGAIETTTRYGLAYPESLIDTYRDLGFPMVFIRPLTPLGYAARNWEEIGYTPEEFVAYYRRCLKRILEVNQSGYFMIEGHARILLNKILNHDSGNYMELRSPCGGVCGQMAYFYDGDIYTCDEGRMLGEMGDPIFRIGNVRSSTFDDVITSLSCRALMSSSYLQSIPECCDCVYQPYCGTCPVLNYQQYVDIYPDRPGGFRCRIYKGILDTLFGYLKEEDPKIMQIFRSWVS